MKKSESADPRAAVAELLLKIDRDSSGNQVDLNLTILRGVRFKLEDRGRQALGTVVKYPEHGEKVVPVLLEVLRQAGNVKIAQLWSRLLCGAIPPAAGTQAQRILWGGYEKVEAVSCP